MRAKMACADGIQECIETVRDLKSCNAEEAYLTGLNQKIKAVEHRAVISEFGTAVFVVSASLLLKLGIATVALVGAILLLQGTLDIMTFFLFLLQGLVIFHGRVGYMGLLTQNLGYTYP